MSPITLHVYGRDGSKFIQPCEGDFDCIQARGSGGDGSVRQPDVRDLGALRTAASSAEIIVIGGWNSSLAFLAESDPLFHALNAAIASVAGPHHALCADVDPVFNPPGEAVRAAAICTLTLLCAEADSYPSDAGYRAIAEVVFDVSGYGRLEGS